MKEKNEKEANLAIIVIIKIRQVDEKNEGKNSLIDSLHHWKSRRECKE